MKFLNFEHAGLFKTGLLTPLDRIIDLKSVFQSLGQDPCLILNDSDFIGNYYAIESLLNNILEDKIGKIETIPLTDVNIMASVLNPSKIICLGLNYKDHAAETGQKLPKLPMLFSKAPTAIIGMDDEIIIPQVRPKMERDPRPIRFLDYEVELAIIIGKTCKRVSIEEASESILGYTILNDVSARMEQMADKQFFRSKSFDTFAPIGPWIVTSDEIEDPMNLKITCKVNGEVMQDSNTVNMNFNVFEIVSFISDSITLLPGDIIGTGTPPGVGAARNPPKSLKAGDLVEMTIEKIGTLRNRIRKD